MSGPEFGPQKVQTCRGATKADWFKRLLEVPAMTEHSRRVHKCGLQCNFRVVKLAANRARRGLQQIAQVFIL